MEEKRICDRCNKLYASPGGCVEQCQARMEGSFVVEYMAKEYIEARMNGEKNQCKAFKPIFDMTKFYS